jgi:hypothetical protein
MNARGIPMAKTSSRLAGRRVHKVRGGASTRPRAPGIGNSNDRAKRSFAAGRSQRAWLQNLARLPGVAAIYRVLKAWQAECAPRVYTQPALAQIRPVPSRRDNRPVRR